MKAEFTSEALRGTPAVAGAAVSAFTLNTWVMIATGVYILLQIAYLARKWWREEHDHAHKARKA
jgi:hypothetical protein